MPPENTACLRRRRVRNLSTLFVTASVALFSLETVSAQDAAAPFRRNSPSPTPSATPEEPAAPPAQTRSATAESPVPKTTGIKDKGNPAAAAGRQENVLNEKPVRAIEPRRSVLQEKPVRAVEPRKPFIRRIPAQPSNGPRASQPTFDISESSWAMAATIRSLEKEWQTAIKNHHVAALDKLLADNLEATSSTGKEGSKSTLLRALREDTNVYKSVRARGMAVRNVGPGMAVVTGIANEIGITKEGKSFKISRPFTDTWRRRKGRWQCVVSKITPAAE